ncbi:uncharacterized protein EV420DRAFT_1480289 [Desarmillaria tabescens]|uniref:Uncharacterized protein n=1 Tax=Armillaria tabescens TaxID=1929756 RepID=A0AA39KAW9_ARMTA|nr:uncharacterized protein EV420DRAFT_1480289 [Desarmillaria tabescens]KAK0457632.1 hypothetical protein EV420DRAFT_1480289 [Desarmillaria tabescens]
MSRTKKGRAPGAKRYSEDESMAMLQLVLDAVPLDTKLLRAKYDALLKLAHNKPTGDAQWPTVLELALKVHDAITEAQARSPKIIEIDGSDEDITAPQVPIGLLKGSKVSKSGTVLTKAYCVENPLAGAKSCAAGDKAENELRMYQILNGSEKDQRRNHSVHHAHHCSSSPSSNHNSNHFKAAQWHNVPTEPTALETLAFTAAAAPAEGSSTIGHSLMLSLTPRKVAIIKPDHVDESLQTSPHQGLEVYLPNFIKTNTVGQQLLVETEILLLSMQFCRDSFTTLHQCMNFASNQCCSSWKCCAFKNQAGHMSIMPTPQGIKSHIYYNTCMHRSKISVCIGDQDTQMSHFQFKDPQPPALEVTTHQCSQTRPQFMVDGWLLPSSFAVWPKVWFLRMQGITRQWKG